MSKTFFKKTHRWSHNERSVGPFTFALDSGRGWAVVANSPDDERNTGYFRVSVPGFSFLCQIGGLIAPHREWVDLSKYEWAKGGGYENVDERSFGFSLSEGYLQLFRGRSSNDSTKDRCWGYFIPWQQWRQVRHEIYDLAGKSLGDFANRPYDEKRQALERAHGTSARHLIQDFDGTEVVAMTRAEEREWRRGEGWFKWVGMFWPKRVRRYLEIEWSAETGPEKGSWKGGITGQSTDLLSGETHEQAMRRFCDQSHRHKGRGYRLNYLKELAPTGAHHG